MYCLVLVGCAEISTAPVLGPEPSGPSHNEIEELDPPKDWPVKIHSHSVYVLWPGYTDGLVSVDANMSYRSSHASIAANLTVISPNGSPLQQPFSPVEKHSWVDAFTTNYHSHRFQLPYSQSCKSKLTGEVVYRVWYRSLGGGGQTVLDEQTAQDYPNSNGDCPPPPPSDGGAGSGEGGHICIYKYDYYVDTGEMVPGSYRLYC
jgi:hypothetical protein